MRRFRDQRCWLPLGFNRYADTVSVKRVRIENFTAFESLDFQPNAGCNVLIGTNGTGKTHLLKLMYSVLFVAQWKVERDDATHSSLFLPPREMLTMYPGFIAAYERRELSFDETFLDLAKNLNATPIKKDGHPGFEELLKSLQIVLGGKVTRKGDEFMLKSGNSAYLEAHLLAEGHRKLAMLDYLIRNGTIERRSTVFWDEPEANLNPQLGEVLVNVVASLTGYELQTFLATHDYLVASRIELAVDDPQKLTFVGLSCDRRGAPVRVQCSPKFESIEKNPIVDAYLKLTVDRHEAWLNSARKAKHG